MTLLDGMVLVVVVLFLLHGYVRGLLRKLGGIAALVGACIGVSLLAPEAASYVRTKWDIVSPWVHVACAVVGWMLLYALLRVVLGTLSRVLLAALGEEVKSWDRKLGALFGAVEALVLCWFVVMIADAFPEDKRAQYAPELQDQMRRSLFAKVVHETSPAARLELQPLIADLITLSEHPQALETVRDEPAILELVRHPKMRRILADRELMQDWQQGRLGRFFADDKVVAALQDPEIRRLLRQSEVRRILHRAADRAGQDDR